MEVENHRAQEDSSVEERMKYADFLLTRLEQIITWTQNSTKLVYLVNGAILAAIYFGIGKVQPLAHALYAAAFLALLLAVVNYLHANFLQSHYAWYKVTEAELWSYFSSLGVRDESAAEQMDRRHKEYFRADTWLRRLFLFRRSHSTFVWMHVAVSAFCLVLAMVFVVLAATGTQTSIVAK